MAKQYSVQTTTDLTITYQHPLVNGNIPVAITGFKMDGELFNTNPLMENSKIIALLGGNTITITNNVTAGTVTFSCIKLTGNAALGDITALARSQINVGDSTGATIIVSFSLNGATYKEQYSACTVKHVPPLKIAGNDIPDYAIEFYYADYTRLS
jgi:hypothetical protein